MLGGALLMQAAHPLAVAGLLAHSDSLEDPYVRLARTAKIMNLITFGSRIEADRATRRVRAMHRAVSGRLPEAVGPYPAGTPYHADDPELLMWILYTLVDSAMVVASHGTDEEIALTPLEFEILFALARDPGVVYARDLGPDSARAARRITEYRRDTGWKPEE